MIPTTIRWREVTEFVVLFAVGAGVLWLHALQGPSWRTPLVVFIACWAAFKTLYYFSETLRHLLDVTNQDLSYRWFLLLIAYNMSQITLSYAVDFYCLQKIDPTSLNGVDPSLHGVELMFECFYFSVLNFAFFGYGEITPAHIPGKVVMLLEVIAAFTTVIFLLSDFACIKESMRKSKAC